MWGTHDSVAARAPREYRAARWSGFALALVCTMAIACARAAPAQAFTDPIGAHSMLQVNSPDWLMQAMFAEAANLHAGAIRVDVAPALIFPSDASRPDFSGLDKLTALAQQYHLRVSADLFTVPAWLADCPTPTTDRAAMARCGTDDFAGYGTVLRQIINHADAVIHDWEIWNEPDNGQFFSGTPAQYAGMLRAAHDAIKQADPQANVLLGGVSSPSGMNWLAQVFAIPGMDAAHAFDIANVHARSSLDELLPDIVSWRWFLAAHGFNGPLWVTEHGYPADAAFQYDPTYGAGPDSQAAYLRAAVPTLIEAGASEVFVTERDNLSGQFASEGLLSGDASGPSPQPLVPRPAYAAVRAIADCYLSFGRACPTAAPVSTPASLAIAAARIGSSASDAITVFDPGPGPLQLGAAALAAGGSPAIAVAGNACPAILEPNQTCRVALRFAPVTGGPQAATLQLAFDAGTLSVPVSAVAPSVASLTSAQLGKPRFTALAHADGVGDTQRLELALSNPLATAVRITRASLSGVDRRQFRAQSARCTATALGPGATCVLTIVFAPTRVGTAHAELSLHGDGQPLQIALQATAHTPPVVRLLGSTGSAACFSPASRNQVVVATNEPATISWRAVRVSPISGAACTGATSSGARLSATGRSVTAGRTATGANRTRVRGRRSYVARLTLPLHTGRSGLRPGLYELTARASNPYGTSHARRMALTVAG